MSSLIEDYAVVGDCETVALVSRHGSIDWLCFPRFDSGACFAALLGTPENGRRLIAPSGDVKTTRRRYRKDTLILETDYEIDSGSVTLIDFMPLRNYIAHPEVDGLPPGEGSFLICTFWLADNLALQGRYGSAREIFERLLDLRNGVGLLSEQYDPAARRLLGNFPQAFSHVGLINTARNLGIEGGPAEDRRRQ